MPRFARFFSQTKHLDRKNRGFQGHDENHAIVQSFCVQLQAAQARCKPSTKDDLDEQRCSPCNITFVYHKRTQFSAI